MTEVQTKLSFIREILRENHLAAIRLRGVDWFAWSTAGGFGGVLITTEIGVAEVLITTDKAWVLADVIEAQRLREEEVPDDFDIWSHPWQQPEKLEQFVRSQADPAQIASDRPAVSEKHLPMDLIRMKRRLCPEELSRYRDLGRDAAKAATEILLQASPEFTELELAAIAAAQLRRWNIDPALIQVGGEKRLKRFRHLLPSESKIGGAAMLAFCGRRFGLYANVTRFVYFRSPSAYEIADHNTVTRIESLALSVSIPGMKLGEIYQTLVRAYRSEGGADQINYHHQGGTTGYLSRELLARPGTEELLEVPVAIAWNPSLPGAKIEDTFVCTENGLDNLTCDPAWPHVAVDGRERPGLLLR